MEVSAGQLGGVYGFGQVDLIRRASVVKLAEIFETLYWEVGVNVMLEVQVTGTKASTQIATADDCGNCTPFSTHPHLTSSWNCLKLP